MPRKCGLEIPFGVYPIAALVSQVVSIAVFIALGSASVSNEIQVVVWSIYCPLLIVVISCWIYCQIIDPGVEGGVGIPCIRESQAVPRWCNQCKKMVPGMDHHCEWLNTCIGKRNYLQFYLLSLFGWMYAAFQFAMGIFLPIDEATRKKGVDVFSAGFFVLVSINLGLSGYLLYHYLNLWTFHNKLLSRGQGTYLYMIEERKRELTEKKKLKEAVAIAARGTDSAAGATPEGLSIDAVPDHAAATNDANLASAATVESNTIVPASAGGTIV